ncbi:hypothetical protein EYF80_013957 [Liparis tanakae]|uniref:Secreted protein n=1 Tax=Liparis tanakae TaxID=230148 RepID=A0A4Z2ICY0_9TELE|nr:hypothetical protein EYF80_013957 [Liparis tanakae]
MSGDVWLIFMAASGVAMTTGGGDTGVSGASTDTTDATGVGSLATEPYDDDSRRFRDDRGLIRGLRWPWASLVVGESTRSLHGIQQSFQETNRETPNRAKPQAVTTSDSRLTDMSEGVTGERREAFPTSILINGGSLRHHQQQQRHQHSTHARLTSHSSPRYSRYGFWSQAHIRQRHA